MRLPPSIALVVPCFALIRCVSEAARMEHTPPPPPFFSTRHARVASAATANVLCVFPLSLPSCSHMSSDTFWSDACRNARNRPLPTLLEALYASCGATVRRPPLLPLGA
jgi:hypothetical protein